MDRKGLYRREGSGKNVTWDYLGAYTSVEQWCADKSRPGTEQYRVDYVLANGEVMVAAWREASGIPLQHWGIRMKQVRRVRHLEVSQ